jgi:hypothetical protein
MPYQHPSGSQKRQKRKELAEKEKETIRKVPRITSFFHKELSTSAAGSKADADVEIDQSTSRSAAIFEADNEVEGRDKISSLLLDEETSRTLDESTCTCSPTTAPAGDVAGLSTDIGLWPSAITGEMLQFWVEKGSSDCQNIKDSYPTSRVEYSDKVRVFTKSHFSYIHEPTQAKVDRNWVCYSDSCQKIFCFYCKLFAKERDSLFMRGFNDWKNASRSISSHEKSSVHLLAIQSFNNMQVDAGRIDAALIKHYHTECGYWRSILQRVVAVVKHLSMRGQAFRGHDELIGSVHNGNYLGILELIAEFDPFLAAHIEKQSALQLKKRSRGSVSYLSSTICEELIAQMGEQVLAYITNEIKAAKYYSVSIDSTPDASKIDRISVIIRYLPQPEGAAPSMTATPKERFLKFLGTNGHSALQLYESLKSFLAQAGIDIRTCRGQSYDNASNMSGKYKGVQALLMRDCSVAHFVPCFGHSLNLAGNESANSVPEATTFFDLLQKIYAFFCVSTHRWKVLSETLSTPTVKSLSQTRWSARADAAKALRLGYGKISEVLVAITNNPDENADTRSEAEGIVKKMMRLEYGFLTDLWATLLNRFNNVNVALQSSSLDLNNAVVLLKSLCEYVATLREQFELFEENGKALSGCCEYKDYSGRKRVRSVKVKRFEGQSADANLSPRDKFRTGVFLAIIDSMTGALQKRLDAYTVVRDLFGFLHELFDMTPESIRKSSSRLVEAYPEDLEHDLANELVHFCSFARGSTGVKQGDDKVSFELRLYRIASAPGVREAFPNVNIALRIYLSLLVTNCSGERSFSVLGRVKNELRTTMTDQRLNHLSLMAIENDVVRKLDFNEVIDIFAKSKARKAVF